MDTPSFFCGDIFRLRVSHGHDLKFTRRCFLPANGIGHHAPIKRRRTDLRSDLRGRRSVQDGGAATRRICARDSSKVRSAGLFRGREKALHEKFAGSSFRRVHTIFLTEGGRNLNSSLQFEFGRIRQFGAMDYTTTTVALPFVKVSNRTTFFMKRSTAAFETSCHPVPKR